jgi:SAM-dependent methyltransferase
MFSHSAHLYDLIYSAFKDYQAESAKLVELLARVAPDAETILDVACGTGEHAKILAEEFGLTVDGLDIDEQLLEVARAKNPGRRFFQADMSGFDTGRTYDVVMCLFSSIAYVRELPQVTATLSCFREHLNPDGRIIVEPWFRPDQWQIGRVDSQLVQTEGVNIARMSYSDARGRISVVTFDYLIGTAAGVEHRHEVHELGLFTTDEMLGCFRDAGLEAEYDPVGLIGRGLYVARAR